VLAGCADFRRENLYNNESSPSAPPYVSQQVEQDTNIVEFVWSNHLYDVDPRVHGGGAASIYYIAHITEQEALGIIRTQLEAAGLNLSRR
jgi:hypothetical protein